MLKEKKQGLVMLLSDLFSRRAVGVVAAAIAATVSLSNVWRVADQQYYCSSGGAFPNTKSTDLVIFKENFFTKRRSLEAVSPFMFWDRWVSAPKSDIDTFLDHKGSFEELASNGGDRLILRAQKRGGYRRVLLQDTWLMALGSGDQGEIGRMKNFHDNEAPLGVSCIYQGTKGGEIRAHYVPW